jgi:hypothetical protein
MLRIGAEGAGPHQFSFIGPALLLEGGRLAIVELAVNEVRLFDSTGSHLRTFGRRGRGPGEFGVISALHPKSRDSLSAYDQTEQRITVFSLENGELRTVSVEDLPTVRGRFDAFGAYDDGRLVLYNPGSSFRPDLAPGMQWDTTPVVVLDAGDGSARTIARMPSREQLVLEGGDSKLRQPAHGSIHAVADNGFYWGTTDRYEIRFYDQQGGLKRIIRRPVEPRPVEPAMIKAWIDQSLETVRQREGEQAIPRYQELYQEMESAEYVPLFYSAFVDRDARLWVGSSNWPSGDPSSRHWSVFAENGTWLGDVQAPPQLRIVDSRGDVVLGIWQDDGEAPFVHTHRLLRP